MPSFQVQIHYTTLYYTLLYYTILYYFLHVKLLSLAKYAFLKQAAFNKLPKDIKIGSLLSFQLCVELPLDRSHYLLATT